MSRSNKEAEELDRMIDTLLKEDDLSQGQAAWDGKGYWHEQLGYPNTDTYAAETYRPIHLDEETVEMVRSLISLSQDNAGAARHFERRLGSIWFKVLNNTNQQQHQTSSVSSYQGAELRYRASRTSFFQLPKEFTKPKNKLFRAGLSVAAAGALLVVLISTFLANYLDLNSDRNNISLGDPNPNSQAQVIEKNDLRAVPLDTTPRNISWSGDGKYLAIATKEKIVVSDKIGRILKTFDSSGRTFGKVAWSPDAKTLAVVSNGAGTGSGGFCQDCTIQLWRPDDTGIDNDPAASKKVIGLTSPVTELAWLPDNVHFLTLSQDKSLCYWVTNGTMIINRLTGAVSMSLTADGTGLATVDSSGNTSLWQVGDLVSGKDMSEIKRNLETVVPLTDWQLATQSWSSSGQVLAQGYYEGHILLTRRNSKAITSYWQQNGNVTAISWSPNGKFLATGSDTGEINIWEVDNTSYSIPVITLFNILRNMNQAQNGAITSLAWSPDGTNLAAAYSKDSVAFWLFSYLNNNTGFPSVS